MENTVLTKKVECNDTDLENGIVEPVIDPFFLLVDGFSETTTNEMIRLYLILLVNPNLDDSFKIEFLRRNRKLVLVKFNRKISFEELVTRSNKIPDFNGSSLIFSQIYTPNTIRVSNLSKYCNKDILNYYFSNSKISKGGEINSIKMFEYENKALIQFKDFSKVDLVLAQTHTICDNIIKIEKYYGTIEDEYTIEENEEELISDQNSLKINSIDVNKCKNQTNNLFTMRTFSTPSLSIDKSKIIISNIQENINIQQLDFYIQLITASNKIEINEIYWSLEKKGKLIIGFKKEIDITKILYEFNNNCLNNLNGKPIHLETVNKTKSLVVLVKNSKSFISNIHSKRLISYKNEFSEEDEYNPELIPITKDLINLYFLNKQQSGGGEIESIERKTSRHWIISVKDYRAIKDILSRNHIIDEKPIQIFPYYENFGLPYLFRTICDDVTSQSKMTNLFKLKIRDERLRYFSKVPILHKKINEILSGSNAISKFNKQEPNILYINYIEKLTTKVPYTERIWRLKVKENIEYFLQIYKYEKLPLTFNQWATISKTKCLNEAFFDSFNKKDDESTEIDIAQSSYENEIKYIGNNCAIISIHETSTNVEINIVGENNEVDKFIVKIKDIICNAYFTFELEEKIIKFKTYLSECEQLLSKWLIT
jgi:hypothetical protein